MFFGQHIIKLHLSYCAQGKNSINSGFHDKDLTFIMKTNFSGWYKLQSDKALYQALKRLALYNLGSCGGFGFALISVKLWSHIDHIIP